MTSIHPGLQEWHPMLASLLGHVHLHQAHGVYVILTKPLEQV